MLNKNKMSKSVECDLWNMEWNRIPNSSFVIKYKFEECMYSVLVTDLCKIYGEKLEESGIQTRFKHINPYAEMKTKVLLKNVQQTVETTLANESATLDILFIENNLAINLQFEINQMLFHFQLNPNLLSCEKFQSIITGPIIAIAQVLHQENKIMEKKINDLEKKMLLYQKQDQCIKNEDSKLPTRKKVPEQNVIKSFMDIQDVAKYVCYPNYSNPSSIGNENTLCSTSLLDEAKSESRELKVNPSDSKGYMKFENSEVRPAVNVTAMLALNRRDNTAPKRKKVMKF